MTFSLLCVSQKQQMASFLASKMRKVQEAVGAATVTEDSDEVKDVKEVITSFIFYHFLDYLFSSSL